MSRSKIGAIIVSFNGNDVIADTVKAIASQVGHVVIIDNGSDEPTLSVLGILERTFNLEIVRLQSNLGIGAALNIGVERLIDRGLEWAITLDQDSTPEVNMVEEFVAFHATNQEINFMCPIIKALDEEVHYNRPVLTAITSGNLIKISLINEVGGYDEGFFIDSIDFDFCLKVAMRGESVFKVCQARMQHQLGDQAKSMLINNFYTNHSPVRRYYIYRNFVHMMSRYFKTFPRFCIKFLCVHSLDFLAVCVNGPKRYDSIKAILFGIYDGVAAKYGICKRHF
ncbi:glycosyltransferase [Gammaproteobacteria bacterium]|nr:glycosyltransferase [Gammaproteobacteria bacterium]